MYPISRAQMLRTTAVPLLWVAFFSCFLNLSYMAAPLYMMQVYDRVMRSQSMSTLFYLTLAVALAYAVFAILDGVRGQILCSVSDIVEESLASKLLAQVTAPLEPGRCRPSSAHISRDLDTVRQFAAGSAVLAFIDLPWAPLYLGVLFLLHWTLGVFAAGICVILIGINLLAERMARGPMGQAAAAANRALRFGDAVAGHANCSSTMGLGPHLATRWQRLRADMLDAQNQASRSAVLLGAIAKFTRLFTQSAILGLGAYLAIDHKISGGAVFAGSLLLGRCLAPVEALIANWRATLTAYHSFTRLQTIELPGSPTAILLPTPSGKLFLERVSWTAPGLERPVLKEITLQVEAGSVLAIVGPNAAGKSTLGRLIAGAIRPESGIVRLDDAEFATWSPAQFGKAVGYLPQDFSLYPGSIRDNIARFADVADSDVIAAAQAAMVHEMILRLPSGYQTKIDDARGYLSGGQRQRVALARALLFEPSVLILDEPSASLDSSGEEALFKCVIAARERKCTVIMITHSTALVRLADYVVTMVNGQISRVQRSTEFFSRPVSVAVGE